MTDFLQGVATVLNLREQNGGHLHHRDCIHNLPPAEQVALRGKTVEWWQEIIGALPVQITPDEWQIESPWASGDTKEQPNEQ